MDHGGMLVNIERALTIPGWMEAEELEFLAQCASKSNTIAEVGSWRGRSATAMADNSDALITCADTLADNAYGNPGWWTESDGPDFCKRQDWLLNAFRENLKDYIPDRVTQIRMHSVDAARALIDQRYNLIFIDAGHRYEDIRNDILAWRPLLADGGIFCGHDYHEHTNPEVVQAVKELVPNFYVKCTIWIAR